MTIKLLPYVICLSLIAGWFVQAQCQSKELNALNLKYGELKHSNATALAALQTMNKARVKEREASFKRARARNAVVIPTPEGYGPDKVNEVLGE